MSTQLPHVPADDLAGIEEALDAHGGVIALNYLDHSALTATREALAAAIADLPWCNTYDAYEDEFFGQKTKRIHGLLDHGPAIENVLLHDLPNQLGRKRLRGDIIMSTGELMAIGPGETRQRLHRDGVSWERGQVPFDFLLSVNIALTDFTRDNGATVIAPGSHLWPPERRAEEAELTFAEMPAGSALVYSGRTLHGGGANITSDTRMGLYFGYIPAWLRPLENPVQTHAPETLTRLGDEARSLLGLSEEGFVAYL